MLGRGWEVRSGSLADLSRYSPAFCLSGGLPFIDPLSHGLMNSSPWMTSFADPDSTPPEQKETKSYQF